MLAATLSLESYTTYGHRSGHMEKQEMEMKWKLETETGN